MVLIIFVGLSSMSRETEKVRILREKGIKKKTSKRGLWSRKGKRKNPWEIPQNLGLLVWCKRKAAKHPTAPLILLALN